MKIILKELMDVGIGHRMSEYDFLSVLSVVPGLFAKDDPELRTRIVSLMEKTVSRLIGSGAVPPDPRSSH